MITVTFLGETYSCEVALKGADFIHLLDENGCMVAAFDGISDFSGFAISGGSWTSPTDADSCCIATIGEDGVPRKSGKKLCDMAGAKVVDVLPTTLEPNTIYFVY